MYGVSSSPKVKEICVSNCAPGAGTPVWKTVLVVGLGFGGTELYALDITRPATLAGAIKTTAADAPAKLIWSSETQSKTSYDAALGLTTSVPAFYYGKSAARTDYRFVFGSSYNETGSSTQGQVLVNAAVGTGAILDSDPLPSSGNNCQVAHAIERVIMPDIATAVNNGNSEQKQLLAAYFGDTWGNLYRYVPDQSGTGDTLSTGNIAAVTNLGCKQPLHFAPAIAQLDSESPSSGASKDYYLVQVTNSSLDKVTVAFPEGSQMIVRKEIASAGGVTSDSAWGTGGAITLATNNNQHFCLSTTGGCTATSTGFPAGVRPMSTPTIVLKDKTAAVPGFVVVSTWFAAPSGCSTGTSYVAVHELTPTGTANLLYGSALASEAVTGSVFVSGPSGPRLVFVSSTGVKDTMSPGFGPNLAVAPPIPVGAPGEVSRYQQYSWAELF
jgi:hypothetical protein